MAAIRIRVGASVDGNAANVFVPLIEASKRARKAVSDNLNATSKATASVGSSARKSASSAEAAFAALEREMKGLPPQMDAGTKSIVRFGQESKTQFAVAKASFNQLAREAEKNAKIYEKALNPKVANDNARGGRRASGDGAARVVGRIGMGAVGMGARLGGDLLRGIGVNTDIASMFAQQKDLEKSAVDLSNAGFMPGAAGANGERQDPRAIAAEARKVANETAFDPAQAMAGLQGFVGKTGDLETGRAVLKDLAVLSKATGTNLEDMVNAAGDVSNALGDIPGKGAIIEKTMRVVAGQGKLGAVEIRDMAKQMAKLAANATQIEGDIGENIGLLGAFAQEARQRGGAASATMAATSVASLISTFKTPARIAAFKAATGQNVYNKDGMMRSPQELLMAALKAKGRDPEGFKAIFANVQGARAVEGFASIYRQSYAGAKGTDQERMAEASAAVTAEFDRLKNVAMANAEVQASFARTMDTTESKVQVFNNKLSETAAEVEAALLPALIQLAPLFLQMAGAIPSLIDWLTDKKAGNKKTVEDTLGALNTQNQLNAAMGGSYGITSGDVVGSRAAVLPAGLLERAKEQQAALDKALADKERDITAMREGLGFNSKIAGTAATEESVTADAKAGKSGAAKYIALEGEAAALRAQSDDLKQSQQAVVEALLGGRMKVQIVGDQAPPPTSKAPPPARGMPMNATDDQ